MTLEHKTKDFEMKTLIMVVALVGCLTSGCAGDNHKCGVPLYKRGSLFVTLAPTPCEAISQASIPADPVRKHEVEFSDPNGLFNLGNASVYYYHREGTYNEHTRSWNSGGAYRYDRQEPYNETTATITPNPYGYVTPPPVEFWSSDPTASSLKVRKSPAPKQQCPKPETTGKRTATGSKIILVPVP